MKQIVLLILILVFGCTSPNKKESNLIINYVEKVSGINVNNGDIILINSLGCRGCIENGLKYLEVNNIRDRYKAIIISEKAIEGIDKSINKGHLIVDYENLLDVKLQYN